MAKKVCSIEGYQDVSPDYYINENGEAFSEGGTRKLKALPNSDGYLQYGFYRTDRRQRRMAAAPLVLTAFGGPRPSADHECDHIDSDKQNNRVSNLRWVPKSKHVHGSATPMADVLRIVIQTLGRPANDPKSTLFKHPAATLSRLLGLTHRQVSNVIRGLTYRSRPASLKSGEVLIVRGEDGQASIHKREDLPTPPIAKPK